MNAPTEKVNHFVSAKELIERASSATGSNPVGVTEPEALIALAQVHATLALADQVSQFRIQVTDELRQGRTFKG